MKKMKLLTILSVSSLLLTACASSGQASDITSASTGLWDRLVYLFAQIIDGLSFSGLTGLGIVLVTIIMRVLLLPLYNIQMKASQKMQALQPELRALQTKYSGKDMDSRLQLTEATQALYKAHDVSPWASVVPLFIQLPILMALFQALTRVEFLRTGHFLWLELAKPDPYFILPILAAGFTFLSTWLTSKANPNKDAMTTIMTYVAPAMILLFSLQMASGVTLYWTVSNAFQVAQLLIFNNPFKAIAEREAVHRAQKEQAAKIRRAKKKAKRG